MLRRFRKALGQAATVLLVRDGGGYVFGAFCPEVWKPSPRFFGTGEAFVFQLAPHKVVGGGAGGGGVSDWGRKNSGSLGRAGQAQPVLFDDFRWHCWLVNNDT
jgi:hypothetical protein